AMRAILIGGRQPPKQSPITRIAFLTSQIGMSGSRSLTKLWRGWRRGAVCSALSASCSRRARSPVRGLPRSNLGKWVAFFRDLPAIAHAAGYLHGGGGG